MNKVASKGMFKLKKVLDRYNTINKIIILVYKIIPPKSNSEYRVIILSCDFDESKTNQSYRSKLIILNKINANDKHPNTNIKLVPTNDRSETKRPYKAFPV